MSRLDSNNHAMYRKVNMQILHHILASAIEIGASDIHLKAGKKPFVRVQGDLVDIKDFPQPMTGEEIALICSTILSAKQKEDLMSKKEIDLAYRMEGIGRFRVHIFRVQGQFGLVFRFIPMKIPNLSDLNLPPILHNFCNQERGLVLVTGATGSGKSTTLAALLNHIHQNHKKHLVSIEDPIEFLLPEGKGLATQRELDTDTATFGQALKSCLRQDPDVIFIGEIRDRDTMKTALMAAETGHLVFSTLHTADTQETMQRILSFFPAEEHLQIRLMLAANLKAVVCQRLLQRGDKSGFVPAVEIFIQNERTKEYILDAHRANHLLDVIEESHMTYHMQSFDQSLMHLLNKGLIRLEDAMAASTRPNDLALKLKGIRSVSRNDHSAEKHLNVDETQAAKLDLETLVMPGKDEDVLVYKRKKKRG